MACVRVDTVNLFAPFPLFRPLSTSAEHCSWCSTLSRSLYNCHFSFLPPSRLLCVCVCRRVAVSTVGELFCAFALGLCSSTFMVGFRQQQKKRFSTPSPFNRTQDTAIERSWMEKEFSARLSAYLVHPHVRSPGSAQSALGTKFE